MQPVSRFVFVALALLATITALPVARAISDCGASTFGVLATSPTVSLCMKDSNIPLLMMSSAPTPEQLGVVCKTPTCRQLLQLLVDLNPQECTIPLGGRFRLRAELIDPAVAYCAGADLPITSETTTTNEKEDASSGSNGNSTSANEITNLPAPTSIASRILDRNAVAISVAIVVAIELVLG